MASIFTKFAASLVLAVGVAFGAATMPAPEQPIYIETEQIEIIEIRSEPKTPRQITKEIWGKDAEIGMKLENCESGFRNIQSYVIDKYTGKRENSWGVFQINLNPDGHPEISKAQALDIEWATRWAYGRYKAGMARKEWRYCYNFIFGI